MSRDPGMDHASDDAARAEAVPRQRPDVGGAAIRAGDVDFDAFYATTPPWDIGRPQPAFLQLAASGAIVGRVLDVGCGTGEHALMAAELGLEVTGVDISRSAITRAETKARERGLTARFFVGDALALASLDEQFGTVLDCGLFHVFNDADRVRYVNALAAVVVPGGRYHLLCFSEHEPGDAGPRRVTQGEIRSSFRAGWRIAEIHAAKIETTILADGVAAWRATMIRT
jgi:SAM-dependent methyltransferase